MLRFPIVDVDLIDLNHSLVMLRRDLTKTFELDDRDIIPILYDSPFLSYIKLEKEEKPTLSDDHYEKYGKLLEALDSCDFYLNALSNERNTFNKMAHPNGFIDVNEEEEEHEFDLKKYCDIITEKGWKNFAETNSLCKLLMSACKTLSSQVVDSGEVLHALKHSLEVYEQAVAFDIYNPGANPGANNALVVLASKGGIVIHYSHLEANRIYLKFTDLLQWDKKHLQTTPKK